MITSLYEKTLNISTVNKEIDEKVGEELIKIYNHYLDKRKGIKKSTEVSFLEIYCDF